MVLCLFFSLYGTMLYIRAPVWVRICPFEGARGWAHIHVLEGARWYTYIRPFEGLLAQDYTSYTLLASTFDDLGSTPSSLHILNRLCIRSVVFFTLVLLRRWMLKLAWWRSGTE